LEILLFQQKIEEEKQIEMIKSTLITAKIAVEEEIASAIKDSLRNNRIKQILRFFIGS